jgi:transposase InsO family protein
LFKKIQKEQNFPIMRIHSDHGREFENARFEEFCHSYGIQQEFSSPITPQQSGVVEQKNRVLQETARVMILFGEKLSTLHVI